LTLRATYVALVSSDASLLLSDRYGNTITTRVTADSIRVSSVDLYGKQLNDVLLDQTNDVIFSAATSVYVLSFLPYTVGRITLAYTLKGSMLEVEGGGVPTRGVTPGPAVALFCRALGKAASAGAVVGQTSTFYIQARDQYSIDLQGPASGTFRASFVESGVVASVMYEGEGRYNVTYVPDQPGIFQLFLNYESAGSALPVGGSPFRLLFLAEPGAAEASTSALLSASNLPLLLPLLSAGGGGIVAQQLVVGDTATVLIQLADEDGVAIPPGGVNMVGDIVVEVTPPPLYPPAVVARADGMYVTTLSAREAGTYYVDVYLRRVALSNSGVAVTFRAGLTDPGTVQVRARNGVGMLPGPRMPVRAGDTAYVHLKSFDTYMNARPYRSLSDADAYKASMQGVENIQVVDLKNGGYHVVFSPTTTGLFSVDVRLAGAAVVSVPVTVTSSTFFAKASALVASSTTVQAGNFFHINITAKDVYGNLYDKGGLLLLAEASGASHAADEASGVFGSPALYTARLAMTETGAYSVMVTHNGETIGDKVAVPLTVRQVL
jgi:hypothetical protein